MWQCDRIIAHSNPRWKHAHKLRRIMCGKSGEGSVHGVQFRIPISRFACNEAMMGYSESDQNLFYRPSIQTVQLQLNLYQKTILCDITFTECTFSNIEYIGYYNVCLRCNNSRIPENSQLMYLNCETYLMPSAFLKLIDVLEVTNSEVSIECSVKLNI